MKCPKCGYNTFEYLDSCKKCGKDLASFKESMGIRPLIFQTASLTSTISAVGSGGQELGGGLASEPDDKLFQWDDTEPSSDSGVVGIDEFESMPAELEKRGEDTSKDPFSFEEEFDIPVSYEQTPTSQKEKDPFGEFSLDDLGASPEEPPQQKAQEAPAFEGFAFEDEEPPPVQVQKDVRGEPEVTEGKDEDDIFGGFVLGEPAGTPEEEVVQAPFVEEEASADSIFGEFAFGESSPAPPEELSETTPLDTAQDIFGEFSFEESTETSLSPEPADLGGSDIFEDKAVPADDSALGAEFSLDAFVDSFSDKETDRPQSESSGSNDFDLDDFLRLEDETKSDEMRGVEEKKPSDDDLDSLFGELDLTEKK